MGSTLAQLAKTNDAIKAATGEVPRFSSWAEHTLKGRVETEDTDLWTFGRPPSRKGTSAVASVDELDGFSVRFLEYLCGILSHGRMAEPFRGSLACCHSPRLRLMIDTWLYSGRADCQIAAFPASSVTDLSSKKRHVDVLQPANACRVSARMSQCSLQGRVQCIFYE